MCPARGGQGVAHQHVAERHGYEPHALVERLRQDVSAADLFLPVLVVQRIAGVPIGVSQEHLARLLGVLLSPGEAIGEPKIADGLTPLRVGGAENHGVVRIAMIHRAADRAAMRSRRIGDKPRAVFLATVPMAPLPAARRQVNHAFQVVIGSREDRVKSPFCPRLGLGLAFCRVDAGLIDKQVIVLGERRAIGRNIGGECVSGREQRHKGKQLERFAGIFHQVSPSNNELPLRLCRRQAHGLQPLVGGVWNYYEFKCV